MSNDNGIIADVQTMRAQLFGKGLRRDTPVLSMSQPALPYSKFASFDNPPLP